MTFWQFIRRGLSHHWRIHLAVALGVMAGTAVLTGALLVGDSVRGSLRGLALDRLGRIDEVLVVPRFFREDLAKELANEETFEQHFDAALPAIMLPATLKHAGNTSRRVNLLATSDAFWDTGAERPAALPKRDEVILNQPLARDLNASVGDEVTLVLPKEFNAVPSESTFGQKHLEVEEGPLKVVAVIPAEGLGRFGLHPNQQLPLNAYTALSTLRSRTFYPELRSKINAVFVTGKQPLGEAPPASSVDVLDGLLKPRVADYGLELQKITRPEYYNLSSERMLLEPPLEEAALAAFEDEGAQPALTYLANLIVAGEKAKDPPTDRPVPNAIPYSIITAVDLTDDRVAGRWTFTQGDVQGGLADDEIVLNDWAFASLSKELADSGKEEPQLGDAIHVMFFEPDYVDRDGRERTVTFKLRAVVPLDETSPANDRHFMPTIAGVTDHDTLDQFGSNAPFKEHYHPARIRKPIRGKAYKDPLRNDDAYYQKYKLTPKAFVNYQIGRRLWGTQRFGKVTSVRLPAADNTIESIEKKLAERIHRDNQAAALGFSFQPVKRRGLEAAQGTTPFNVLFISFSFFIIAAAVMLVALLFRLGIESRAEEIGTLLAAGFSGRKVRRLLGVEGLVVAAIGGLFGTAAGLSYAALMLLGLRTLWVGAVTTPFLELHWTWPSFVVGYLSGVVISFAAVWWTLRRMRRLSVRRLLAGRAAEESDAVSVRPRVSRWVAVVSLALAGILVIVASMLGGEAQAGAFFGSGFAVLVGLLALLWGTLRRGSAGAGVASGGMPLVRLACRNGARHPSRSTLTIGLVASATFLIIAISAFQMDPGQQGPELASGNGGFALVAESAAPIVEVGKEVRRFYEIEPAKLKQLEGVNIYSLRVKPGEDASCKNLYQTKPSRLRVLGVPEAMIGRGGFSWAGTAAETDDERKNPWRLLTTDAGKTEDGKPYVPVVLDAATAKWSLHLGGALGDPVGSTFFVEKGAADGDASADEDPGERIPAKVIGLLAGSIFQGDLLMSERHLLEHNPDLAGARFFLVEVPKKRATPKGIHNVQTLLETALEDQGFDAESAGERLASFLAVQNTYLSTFQSLGALGLLLGTFGLATVQLRNVLERRGELALLRAAGFRRGRVAGLVMAENALLLAGGLGIGTLAALVAVLPHLFGGGATIPIGRLALTLAAILAAGLLAGLAAVRATVKAPVIQALRGD